MKLAFIVPRFGINIRGGAEQLCYGLSKSLVANGHEIQIWTTCAENHYTWENIHSPGISEMDGMQVHRFMVEAPDERWETLSQKLHTTGALSSQQQYDWLAFGPHSTKLYQHIARHAAEVDKIIAVPYAMTLTQYATWIAPARTILIPCFHDESYAYMEWSFLSAESVFGIMFNTPEEQYLAVNQLGMCPLNYTIVGAGITPITVPKPSEVQNQLLYVGRLEAGKNVHLLYDYVLRLVEEGHDLTLGVVGTGPLEPPDHPAFTYYGSVSDERKSALCASSMALCQPSVNESFSLVIMESWYQARPVLVHSDCSVTRGHVDRSHGGLCFKDYEEFGESIRQFQNRPETATQMGEDGRKYVEQNYLWPSIAQRFESVIMDWLQDSIPASADIETERTKL